jgi:hypothetical protein
MPDPSDQPFLGPIALIDSATRSVRMTTYEPSDPDTVAALIAVASLSRSLLGEQSLRLEHRTGRRCGDSVLGNRVPELP